MQSWPRISKDDFRYKWKLDRLDVLNLGSEFEQRRAVNLEVFDESHRAVENFFTLCEVAVGYYTRFDAVRHHSFLCQNPRIIYNALIIIYIHTDASTVYTTKAPVRFVNKAIE